LFFNPFISVDFDADGDGVIIDDLDNDGTNELIAAAGWDHIDPMLWDYCLYIYKQDTNHELYQKEKFHFSDHLFNSMASGNLDSNALKDIVVAPGYSDTILIFYQTDTLKFEKQVKLPVPYGYYNLACGDLNNDGLDDIAAIIYWESSLKIFYQNENGTFHDTSYYKLSSGKNEILISDFNKDGCNDVIISNGTILPGGTDLFTFGIYLQDTTNHCLNDAVYFDSPTLIYNYTDGIAVGDLNGDNLPDVVTSHWEGLKVWLQKPENNTFSWDLVYLPFFSTNSCSLGISDLNHDGRNEIIGPVVGWSEIAVYESDEEYKFSNYQLFDVYATAWFQRNLAVGDINDDNYADIVVSSSDGIGGFSYLINTSYLPHVSTPSFALEDGLQLYPNPANEYLMFSLSDIFIGNRVFYKIYNLGGELILEGQTHDNPGRIQLGNLRAGLYIISLQSGDKIITGKFLKSLLP
jgi:hypothetical protein